MFINVYSACDALPTSAKLKLFFFLSFSQLSHSAKNVMVSLGTMGTFALH